MLRETGVIIRTPDGECDCGILKDIVDGLNKVVDQGEEEGEVVEVGEEGAEGAEEETPEEGGEEGGEEMSPVEGTYRVPIQILY